MEIKGFFSIWNHHKCLSKLFPLHLKTYAVGLWPFWICNSSSAGIDFRRQILTSIDVRIWRLKSVPAPKGSKCCVSLSVFVKPYACHIIRELIWLPWHGHNNLTILLYVYTRIPATEYQLIFNVWHYVLYNKILIIYLDIIVTSGL